MFALHAIHIGSIPINSINDNFLIIKNLSTFDVETYYTKGSNRIYIAIFYHGPHVPPKIFYSNDFQSYDIFLNHICKYMLSLNGVLWSHNGFKFDLSFLLKRLIPLSYSYNFTNQAFGTKSFSSLQFTKPNQDTLLIADTFKIFPTSLSKLSSVVNYPKLSFPHHSVNDSLLLDTSFRVKAIDYCLNDCIIVYKVVLFLDKFLSEHFNLSIGLSTTAPSIAMKIFRHVFLPKHRHSNHLLSLPPHLFPLIQPSYFGGRCEVFKPFYPRKALYMDVNSLYPFVMSKFPYPFPYIKSYTNLPPSKISHFYGFADVTVHVNPCPIPFLPYRFNNRIYYPTGTFRGTFFIPELLNAMKLSPTKILAIHHLHSFHKSFHLFSSYVKFFYDLRLHYQSTNLPAGQQFCKLALNSLYGRFGLNPQLPFLSFNSDLSLSSSPLSTPPLSNIAIASAITSYARIWMSQFLKSHILYTDTDSLFSPNTVPTPFVGPNLGSFKVVSKTSKAFFLGSKMYSYTDPSTHTVYYKCSGLSSDLLNLSLFSNLYHHNLSSLVPITKFFPDPLASTVHIKDLSFLFQLRNLSRVKSFDSHSLWVNTLPFSISYLHSLPN